MAYSDFTFDRARRELGLTVRVEALFPGVIPVPPPPWLNDTLGRNRKHPLVSEKSRGEIIVFPILVAARELAADAFTVFSGHAMTGDAELGLTGECDFILARTEALPAVAAPLLTIVEAKKADIDLGLGQCMAQMVGARLFNERDDIHRQIFGCVTTGELWQFLRLDGDLLRVDPSRLTLSDLGDILAALLVATAP